MTTETILKNFIEAWNIACQDEHDIEYAQEQVLKSYEAWWPKAFHNEIQDWLNEFSEI